MSPFNNALSGKVAESAISVKFEYVKLILLKSGVISMSDTAIGEITEAAMNLSSDMMASFVSIMLICLLVFCVSSREDGIELLSCNIIPA